MKKIINLCLLLMLGQFGINGAYAAALQVMACEPEWGALAKEIGGDDVVVYTATTGLQDPHRIEARPSLIAQVRRADMLVCTGADLEAGWLPLLLRQAGNPRVQPGAPGYFEAASFVTKLEIPTRLDRSEGDVHAAGNPHIQTDPRNIAQVAEALSKRLGEVDPAHAAAYQSRHAAFSSKWNTAMQRWEKRAAPLKGVPIVVQHRGFPYLSNWLGLREVATLESKPGIEPSSSHLSAVLAQLQRQPAKMVIHAAYQGDRASAWLASRAHIPVVELPFTVGGTPEAQDLFSLFDDTVQRLLKAVQAQDAGSGQ